MSNAQSTSTKEPRGRLLFPRGEVVKFLERSGLQGDAIPAADLSPYIGVRHLARLLDVSPSWIRQLHRRKAIRGVYLRPPLEAA